MYIYIGMNNHVHSTLQREKKKMKTKGRDKNYERIQHTHTCVCMYIIHNSLYGLEHSLQHQLRKIGSVQHTMSFTSRPSNIAVITGMEDYKGMYIASTVHVHVYMYTYMYNIHAYMRIQYLQVVMSCCHLLCCVS